MTNPTIVVVAYNRTASLQKLLNSLSQAEYSEDEVNLIISIDYSGDNKIYKAADAFQWQFGHKKIIRHNTNLGLRKHILSCGDLVLEHESVIILEDDLIVSPYFYKYAKTASNFYFNNLDIAGISLYQYQHNESTKLPFEVIMDEFDAFFMQVPSSWGQLWTKSQWHNFKEWYNQKQTVSEQDYLPDDVIDWPESSWKKYFNKYLVETNRYFVYPKASFTTNTGAVGEHHNHITALHQSSLSMQKYDYRLPQFNETVNSYDQFFEIIPKSTNFNLPIDIGDIEIDIFGSKLLHKVKKKYLLSSKNCKNPIQCFKVDYFPVNLNAIRGLQQTNKDNAELFLGETTHFDSKINPLFIKLFAQKIDNKIVEYLEHSIMQNIVKTSTFRIGHRIERLIKAAPFKVGAKILNILDKKNKTQ